MIGKKKPKINNKVFLLKRISILAIQSTDFLLEDPRHPVTSTFFFNSASRRIMK